MHWLGMPSIIIYSFCASKRILCATLNGYTHLITELIYILLLLMCVTQVNSILLTISLVSLAKSQCGNIADSKNDKQTQQYLQTGK